LKILAAADETPEAHGFVVISPFEPLGIYSTLAARGFCYQTERLGHGAWLARFFRSRRAVPSAATASQEGYPGE
jgi:hypothetical protein